MKQAYLVILFLTAGAFGQGTTSAMQAESSGKCSPNILSNQGQVTFTCNAPMDKATASRIVDLLNQILQQQQKSDQGRQPVGPNDSVSPSGLPCIPGRPRVSSGPDKYKAVCDEDLAKWGIEQSEQVADIGNRCWNMLMQSGQKGSVIYGIGRDSIEGIFRGEFHNCCWSNVDDTRAEIAARLGPEANRDEPFHWKLLTDGSTTCADYQEYAPLYRWNALTLKHRAASYKPSISLDFSTTNIPPIQKIQAGFAPSFKGVYSKVRIAPKVDIPEGFVVVEFSSSPAFCSVSSKKGIQEIDSSNRGWIANKPLLEYLTGLPFYTVLLRIWQAPIGPDNPVEITSAGEESEHFHVTKVTWFDE